MGLLCSCSWFTFGMYKSDIPVIVPNGLGIVFSIINLSCWIFYYRKAKNNPSLRFLQENEEETASPPVTTPSYNKI